MFVFNTRSVFSYFLPHRCLHSLPWLTSWGRGFCGDIVHTPCWDFDCWCLPYLLLMPTDGCSASVPSAVWFANAIYWRGDIVLKSGGSLCTGPNLTPVSILISNVGLDQWGWDGVSVGSIDWHFTELVQLDCHGVTYFFPVWVSLMCAELFRVWAVL